MLGCSQRQPQHLICHTARQIQRRPDLVPGILRVRVGRVPLSHWIIRCQLHLDRFAKRARILWIVIHDHLSPLFAVIINPLGIRTGQTHTAKRGILPEQVKLFPLHIPGIAGIVRYRVKHNSFIKTNSIVAIRAVNHQPPLIIVACLECSKRCLVTLPAARTHKCFDRNAKFAVGILLIDRHTVCRTIDHNLIRRSCLLCMHCQYAAFRYHTKTHTKSQTPCCKSPHAQSPPI